MRIITKNLFKKRNTLVDVLKTPASMMLLISLVVLTIHILFIGSLRPFNSDDLYWQQVVRTWVPFSGDILYLATKDTFIEIVPFLAIMESLFAPGREVLLAEAVILTTVSFIFFYISSLYFLKKLNVKITYPVLLPFVWLASFGYPLVQNYLNIDWRTFEIGIAFLTYTFVAAICFGDFKPLASTRNKVLSVLATVYIGIVAFSDPYYVYFAIAPIALFVGFLYILKKIKRTDLVVIYSGIVLSMVFAHLTGFLLEKSGVIIVAETPSVFVNFDNIVTNIVASLHGLLIIFNADFFGRPIAKISTVIAAANAVILGIILYKVYSLRKTWILPIVNKIPHPMLWVTFFAFTLVFIFFVYTISSLVLVSNYRFFIIFVYCAIAFLALTLAVSRNKVFVYTVSTILVIATLANIVHTTLSKTITSQPDVANNIGNSRNFEIIEAVEKEGLTKGYGSYWQSNVNTYFANGKVTFLPIICDHGATKPFKWLIDGSQFNRGANKSFYIIDPTYPHPPVCTFKELKKQFGEPVKILKLENKSILVYNYDIGTKMIDNWLP